MILKAGARTVLPKPMLERVFFYSGISLTVTKLPFYTATTYLSHFAISSTLVQLGEFVP
jgi:hypothetical protein